MLTYLINTNLTKGSISPAHNGQTSMQAGKQVIMPKVTILGIGNLLLQDDGIGIHLVQRLEKIITPGNITLVDCGTVPDFTPYIEEGQDKLIIVDAAMKGGQPGTIYHLSTGDLASISPGRFSSHYPGIASSLEMLRKMGKQPGSIVIFGIEPGITEYGLELSPELETIIPRLSKLVLQEAMETGIPDNK
jgi:hydrogenase maturation protease